ncbi:MAG TPA: selenide, water dikinase SelD, partial [Anaerolineae bacterium]|nr:selenide, water dikinase SelD [Anaerolineae bacterium]
MGPQALAQVLRPLREMFRTKEYPNLLVGLDPSDDAAVYKISEDAAIIQTLDFFPPVVDDPYDYGAIAAANAMSDVYAMGGEVVLALNICGFPPDMDPAIVAEILRGGAEKVAEAGAVLAGGHTLDDREPKYGLAVMGIVHPERVLTKAGARPGDVLVLTKPLGVGIITTALKGDMAEPAHVAAAVESMKRLNRKAAQLMQQVEVHACTDITGFALLGHAQEMAALSGVRIRFYLERLPFLEGAKGYAEDWLFPGGTCRNQKHYSPWVRFAPGIPEEMQMLLFTPETSGGLLIAVAGGELERLLALFQAEGQEHWVVGEVVEGEGVEVRIAPS